MVLTVALGMRFRAVFLSRLALGLVLLAAGCSAGRHAAVDPDIGQRPAAERPAGDLKVFVDDAPMPANEASVDELIEAAESALALAGDKLVELEGASTPPETGVAPDTTLAGGTTLELDRPADTGGDALVAYQAAMQEALHLAEEAADRLAVDPAMYPALKAGYDKLLASLRSSLETDVVAADPLSASEAELAVARQAAPADGASYELPVDPENPLVQKFLALFKQGERKAYLERTFWRAGRYRDFIQQELAKRKLPSELWIVPVIESGYVTSAHSRAAAVGIWQFVASTARNYGLTVNHWIDERRDPYKSTVAALDYLQDLYRYFNNWDLALAAYNRGEHGIRRDLRNTQVVDFLEMAELGGTHRETKNHVPKIHAATIISKDPERYGFSMEFDQPVEADTVLIDYVVDLEVAARCVGITERELRDLNPEVRMWVTPVLSPDYPEYALKLPVGTKELYRAQIAQTADLTPRRHITYVVRRGDNLGGIGRRFGVSWRKVQRWNNLRGSRIYPGQKLTIFPNEIRSPSASSPAAAAAAPRRTKGRVAHAKLAKDRRGQHYIYAVRSGDTLTHIARDFGVTVRQLQAWNGVRSRIVVGQKLKIRAAPAGEAVHVVERGDTLIAIAKRYGTSVGQLRAWNKLGRYLYPGQKLRVAGR